MFNYKHFVQNKLEFDSILNTKNLCLKNLKTRERNIKKTAKEKASISSISSSSLNDSSSRRGILVIKTTISSWGIISHSCSSACSS
jgi:hypothetical protein